MEIKKGGSGCAQYDEANNNAISNVVIEGEIKCAGRGASVDEMYSWLEA